MKLIEYLLFSIQNRCYTRRDWMLSVFCVTQPGHGEKIEPYLGQLIKEPFGFFVYNPAGEKVAIKTERKLDEPLFSKKDTVTIDSNWLPNCTTEQETTVGRLIANAIAIYEPFGRLVEYQNKPMTPEKIEKLVAGLINSEPKPGEDKDPSKLYVENLVKFQAAVSYLESFSGIFSHSVTPKGLVPPPGRHEFRKALLKEYDGQLTDPVKMGEFEDKLKKFDAEYLKDDPSYGKFLKGKVIQARTAGFLTQGGEANNFTGALDVVPIIPGREEGIPLDPVGFTAISNTIRYGSFARGAETVNGGVVAKGIMRAVDNWRITPDDCGTTLGKRMLIRNKTMAEEIVGRHRIESGKSVLISNIEEANAFIGKVILLRSSQYCRKKGNETCHICAGEKLSKFPNGVTIPLADFSGGLLADSLKQMHNSKLQAEVVDLSSVIS